MEIRDVYAMTVKQAIKIRDGLIFVGVFIGHGIYVAWDFKTRPELYAMQSAPWYTSIFVYGIFTLVVLGVCLVTKVIIKHSIKKRNT